MQKIIYLFRHGEVEEKYADCYRGQIDCNLSPEGEKTAIRTAQFLLRQHIELIITTAKIRTDIVATHLQEYGIPHMIQPGFQEMNLGMWEGMPKEKVWAEYAAEYARMKNGDLDAPIPGTDDTPRKLRERVASAWQSTLMLPHKKVGIVAHAGANAILLSQIKNEDPQFNQKIGAMNEIHVTDEGVFIVQENITIED